MLDSITSIVLQSIQKAPSGILTLDILDSLKLTDRGSLKTILSRLNRQKQIMRLKRGAYATYPLVDAFAAAQMAYGGYLGVTSALYLNNLISEIPFTIFVISPHFSGSKTFGAYEFRCVALKEKAVGFQFKGKYVVSTRPKTLFDCIYLPQYGVEQTKLINAFKENSLSKKEWIEFDSYVSLIKPNRRKKFYEIKKLIRSSDYGN